MFFLIKDFKERPWNKQEQISNLHSNTSCFLQAPCKCGLTRPGHPLERTRIFDVSAERQ